MDIHEYFGVLRRGWALIALGLIVGIVGALGAQSLQVPSYSATSRELLTTDTSGNLTQSLQASSFAEARIASYVLVASSGLVLQPVIDELGLDTTVDELASTITVTAPPQTLVIDITATAITPALARDIANTTSRVFTEVVTAQVQPMALAPVDPAVVVDPLVPVVPPVTVVPMRIVNIEEASLPPDPQSSGPLFLLLGGFLGLAAGLVAASLRETTDRRIRNRAAIATVTATPVVGAIRGDRKARMTPLVVSATPGSAIADSFRGLRANLEHVRVRSDLNSFVVTGIARLQGASTVTANLALALGNTATSVVVVDANLASPRLTAMFEASGARGLIDVLSGDATLDDVLRQSASGDTWILPVGSHQPRTSELLATAAMRDVLAELRDRFEVVLVDAPPVTSSPDAAVFALFGSGTLLVVPVGTRRPALTDALAALELGGSVPAGIVLNRIPRGLRGRRSAVARTPSSIRPAPELTAAMSGLLARAELAGRRGLSGVRGLSSRAAARALTSVTTLRAATNTAAPVDVIPTLPVSPDGLRVPRRVADHAASRFAPDETTAPPVRNNLEETPTLVTTVPVLAPTVASRRSSRPAGSPKDAQASASTADVESVLTDSVEVATPVAEFDAEFASDSTSRQSLRARESHRAGPHMVTVGGYSNVTDITASISRERIARESYEIKSRELERAADERLAFEQQLIERRIREQLEAGQRQLDSTLDELLEDTIILPRSIANS